jgi:hypothetical protein
LYLGWTNARFLPGLRILNRGFGMGQ